MADPLANGVMERPLQLYFKSTQKADLRNHLDNDHQGSTQESE